ncbi:MAG TPA: SpoIIE family protein phosphatase [Terracidiphilus sp.]|nr:SpoIIE family protein phosphatase [Terracidiphilus sp.]
MLAGAAQSGHAAAQSGPAPVLHQELGKEAIQLDGAWQFHLGDNPAWAQPDIDDATGHNGWEQLTADAPWGTQGHANYTGYAWYRRHIDLTMAPGAPADVAMMIPAIDEVYEFYWNGQPMGHYGSFPPRLNYYYLVPPQTWGLGQVRSGVLAVRVYKIPLASNDDGTAGGFEAPPVIGSPRAIAALKTAADYQWLSQAQFRFGLTTLYALIAILSLAAWLRDRRQWLLFWMMVFTFMPVSELLLNGMRLQVSGIWLTFITQFSIQLREISQWFLLIWLLQLHENARLVRWVRIAAIVSTIAGTLDGALGFFYSWLGVVPFQISDAVLTFFILPGEAIPILLVLYAVTRRRHLDSASWLVAGFALLSGTFYAISNIAAQGVRFTHWTLAASMTNGHVTIFGIPFTAQLILRTLLFLSIVYAVAGYAMQERRRRAALELEFQNAREIQQVLVPEILPAIPGFTLSSSYKPALEVGGDFFQIVPLGDESTLIVLGDVSGKGLRAAMAVSLIVGAVRSIAETISSPAAILSHLNRNLFGQLQGGFATCIALRLGRDGSCVAASAGHPAPLLNDREIELAGAVPLGVVESVVYEERGLQLSPGDHLALYTDGLLEARGPNGELYGFERLYSLFAARPGASSAAEAAVAFGQEDDITVLTLERATA